VDRFLIDTLGGGLGSENCVSLLYFFRFPQAVVSFLPPVPSDDEATGLDGAFSCTTFSQLRTREESKKSSMNGNGGQAYLGFFSISLQRLVRGKQIRQGIAVVVGKVRNKRNNRKEGTAGNLLRTCVASAWVVEPHRRR
jgi:hypothetical protein